MGTGMVSVSYDLSAHILLRDCYPERFETTGNARTIMLSELPATEIVPKARVFTFADDVAPDKLPEPFAAVNPFSKGKCVYFGGNIARVYRIYGNPELRSIFKNMLEYCGKTPIKTNAPPYVELAVYKKSKDYIIHLMNYALGQLRSTHRAGGYAAEHTIPVYDIDISVRWEKEPPEYVILENCTKLTYSLGNGWLSFTVPKLEIHMLVIVGLK